MKLPSLTSDVSLHETSPAPLRPAPHPQVVGGANPPAAANNNNDNDDDDDYDDDEADIGNPNEFRTEFLRVAKDCDIPIKRLLQAAKESSVGASAHQQQQQHHQQQLQQQSNDTSSHSGQSVPLHVQRPSALSEGTTSDHYGTTSGAVTVPGAAAAAASSGAALPPLAATAGAFGPSGRSRIPHVRVVHVDLSDLIDEAEGGGAGGGGVGGGVGAGAAGGAGALGGAGARDESGGPVLTLMSNATAGASSVGTRDHEPLLSGGGGQGGAGGGIVGLGGGDKPRRGVKFQSGNELETVIFYEVENSVYMRIEYRRPFFGWLCLTVALLAQSAQLTAEEYLHREKISPYASAMWISMGQLVLMVAVCLAYTAACYSGQGIGITMLRYSVLTQIGVAGLMYTLVSVARQAGAQFSHSSRQMTASALHPFMIAMFGLVFRNTVFYEEIAGILVFIGGFALATMPEDITVHLWGFAEVVALSQAIYTASMLFTLVKARASSVPTPVLCLCCSLVAFVVQCFAAPAAKSPYGTDLDFDFTGFMQLPEHRLAAMLGALFSTAALLSFVKALQFLPPITVSVAIALSPILAVFESRILDDTKRHASQVFTVYFSSGATISVMAAIYVLYISSIKRQRVDMLMRSLSRRRRPRDPYNRMGLQAGAASQEGSPTGGTPYTPTEGRSGLSGAGFSGGGGGGGGGAGDEHGGMGGAGSGGDRSAPGNDEYAQRIHSPHQFHYGHLHHQYVRAAADADGNSPRENFTVSTLHPTGRRGSSDLATSTPPMGVGGSGVGGAVSGSSLTASGGAAAGGGGVGGHKSPIDPQQQQQQQSQYQHSSSRLSASSEGSAATPNSLPNAPTIESHLNRSHSHGRTPPVWGMGGGRRSGSGAAQVDD